MNRAAEYHTTTSFINLSDNHVVVATQGAQRLRGMHVIISNAFCKAKSEIN